MRRRLVNIAECPAFSSPSNSTQSPAHSLLKNLVKLDEPGSLGIDLGPVVNNYVIDE